MFTLEVGTSAGESIILATGDKLQTVNSEQRWKRFASNGFLSQNELSNHTALNLNLGSQMPTCEALGRGPDACEIRHEDSWGRRARTAHPSAGPGLRGCPRPGARPSSSQRSADVLPSSLPPPSVHLVATFIQVPGETKQVKAEHEIRGGFHLKGEKKSTSAITNSWSWCVTQVKLLPLETSLNSSAL